jgi:hypothetical protein
LAKEESSPTQRQPQQQQPQQQNSNYQEIKLDNDLLDLGVTRFIKQGNLVHIHIEDGKGKIAFNILPKNFQSTVQRFRKAAKDTGILSDRAIADIEKHLTDPDKKYLKYLNPEADPSNTFGGGMAQQQDIITYATVYEHESKLYEAVKIGDLNCFLEVVDPYAVLEKTKQTITESGHGKAAKVKTSNKKKTAQFYQDINIVQEIVLPDTDDGRSNRVLHLLMEEYLSIPYTFKSKEEFDSLVAEVRQYKNPEPLYFDVKKQWGIFTRYDDEHKTICASDAVFTYFQDKLGLTHYLLFVGAKNSGKSANLFLFKVLGYRNAMSSDMPSSDLYSLAGNTTKDGSYTISDNEVTNLEKEPKKLQVYKDGYTIGIDNHRLDTTFGRKVLKLNGYCFKAISLEHVPEGDNVEGFLQRCINFTEKEEYKNSKL